MTTTLLERKMPSITSIGTDCYPHGKKKKLWKEDWKLFKGTCQEVSEFLTPREILRNIDCDFTVNRWPLEYQGRVYPNTVHWFRSDNDDLLGTFGNRRDVILKKNEKSDHKPAKKKPQGKLPRESGGTEPEPAEADRQ